MMAMRAALTRLAAVATLVAVGVSGAPGAAAANVQFTHDFFAEAGDACGHSYTKGTVAWPRVPAEPPVINVQGAVVSAGPQRPATCSRPRPSVTYAHFTTYVTNIAVQRESRRVGWLGAHRFAFTLDAVALTPPSLIGRLEVQVCQSWPSTGGNALVRCGSPQVYPNPMIGPPPPIQP